MLTPEERLRIEDEERKRHEEEQYRAEVRARLQQTQPSAVPASPAVEASSRTGWILGISVVLIIGALVIVGSSSSRTSSSDDSGPAARSAAGPFAKTRFVPVNQKIATGQLIVKANGYVQYQMTITPDMVKPTVTGNFIASGGTGNDIEAVLTDEVNYINWINGHQARVFWGTEGKQTTGNFELHLRPGTYYIVFSNKFSAFSDKQVFLEVDLKYNRAETYY